MREADWTRLRPLLERLIDLPPEAHAAALDEACGDDPELRRRALEILERERREAGFLEPPERRADVGTGGALRSGARLGAWRLVEEIGSGGMGTVWLAERADGEFEMRAALKVLRGVATDELLARFHTERQLLARLEHPGIARLVDGGATETGVPYLVMEHVRGERIDVWCDQRALDVAGRVALIRAVCDAVAHAHARLVVHRDLKPSNVLVSEDGAPILLDFGIAKVLEPGADESTDATLTELRRLTPNYASPEQVLGGEVTIASDVYSLGVVLYEVLAGRRPHDYTGTGLVELARRVAEDTPPPPSSVAPPERRRWIAGDLDTITAKAMHKDPDRRYRSAEQLSEDLRRHLEGHPVLACPDSLGYRIGKLVRRNPVPVALTVLLGVVLIGSSVVSAGLFLDARAARDVAQARFGEVRSLARELLFDVYDEVERLPGATAARRRLVETGLAYLDGLSAEAGDDRALLLEIAEGYQRLGDVQGLPGRANLGDTAGALASYRAGLEVLVRVEALDGGDASRRARAILLERVGDVQRQDGRPTEALEAFEEVRRIAEAEGSEDPRMLAGAWRKRADVRFAQGDVEGAREDYGRAEQLARAAHAADPDDPRASRDLLVLLGAVASLDMAQREPKAARGRQLESLALAETLLAARPRDAQARRDVAHTLGLLGYVQVALGDRDAARTSYERERRLYQELSDADPSDVLARSDLALAYSHLASVEDEPERALESYRGALGTLLSIEERDAETERLAARHHLLVASTLEKLERESEAVDHCRSATTMLSALRERDPKSVLVLRDLSVAWNMLGKASHAVGELQEALEASERGLDVADALNELEGALPWDRDQKRKCLMERGGVLEALGERTETPTEERRVRLSEALGAYRRARDWVRETEGEGAEPSPVAGELEARIQACSAALERLGGSD